MSGSYDLPFQSLREEIQQYSPRSTLILDIMREQTSAKVAFFAAFVIVCIQAERALHAELPPVRLTAADLSEFTFFEVAINDPIALNLFDRLLEAYQTEPSI